MHKAKKFHNLDSFVTIRRADWVMKISIFKSKYVMIIGQHFLHENQFFIRWFDNREHASNFLDMLAQKNEEGY